MPPRRRQSLYHRLRHHPQVRFGLFVLGIVLMLVAPLAGVLPGPGFIILFPLGLALALRNSRWAKRMYVRFKRRHPRYGHLADRGMRRASARRRRSVATPPT